nr:hypothetical protein [Tanacetum cinerariifolium]
MMIYLKNTAGYKMDFFKGMTYAQICPIFQARFDENMRFLFKSSEEVEEKDQEIIKSINETPAQKVAQRRKPSEEAQEAEDLRKRLEEVDDEDDEVFIEATPLARKFPVVDYQIVLVDNKPRFKIIKADETHQLYISFTTLMKNFDREDLENLWRIVKERFPTSKPTNFLDEYLLLTLKTMFEEPDGQDAIWRNQKSLFLLVERRYPLSRFTLEQLVNVTRLQVEKESEMSLKLLRFSIENTHQTIEVVTAVTSQVSAASTTIHAASATIPSAKPSIPAAAPTVVAAYTRKRKGVIIRDPEKELSSRTPDETPKVKDKGKGIMVETPKPMKKKDQIELDAKYSRKLHEEINMDEFNKDIDWDAAMDHVNEKSNNPQYIKRYQGMKKRPQTESEARKNMMIYLKNIAGYKMDFFKGMTYAQICPIFQARFDENMRFLFKSSEEIEEEDQEIIKSINETPPHKAAKRRKLSEEVQEAEDLRKRLEVVEDEDDDVFIEATPLASKVPVMDYQIILVDNKPRFKIIRADETHQFYISFTTILKNFDREDLENLWRIVKDRFSTSKPTNFLDEYLLLTLKTVFEEPDGQDAIWRNQKSVHGLALVKKLKLLTLCGVHVITLSIVQLFLLFERRYPLSRFTLK